MIQSMFHFTYTVVMPHKHITFLYCICMALVHVTTYPPNQINTIEWKGKVLLSCDATTEIWAKKGKVMHSPKLCEDVTGTGSIFATMKPGTKLTNGLQQIQVVASYKVLCQADDCVHQWILQRDTLIVGSCMESGHEYFIDHQSNLNVTIQNTLLLW